MTKPPAASPRTDRAETKRGPTVSRSGLLLFDLDHVDLQAELPPGWQHAEDLDRVYPGPLDAMIRTSLLFEGPSSDAPTSALLLGTTTLPPQLRSRRPLAGELLLSIAQFVEYEVASKVQAEGIYRARTCELTRDILGRLTALCDGDALGLDATAAVHTYVRLDRDRAVFALFISDESVADPRGIADGIVASLR